MQDLVLRIKHTPSARTFSAIILCYSSEKNGHLLYKKPIYQSVKKHRNVMSVGLWRNRDVPAPWCRRLHQGPYGFAISGWRCQLVVRLDRGAVGDALHGIENPSALVIVFHLFFNRFLMGVEVVQIVSGNRIVH